MAKTATAVAEKSPVTKRIPKIHIYKVEVDGEVKLVRTTSRAKAIKHLNRQIVAAIPTVDELVELVKEGVPVEDAVAS